MIYKSNMLNNIYAFLHFILLFYVLFVPPIFPKSWKVSYIILLIMAFNIIIKYNKYLCVLQKNKFIKRHIMQYVIFILYVVIISLIGYYFDDNNIPLKLYLKNIRTFTVDMLALSIIVLYETFRTISYRKNISHLLIFLIFMGVMQGVFASITFIFSNIKEYIDNLALINGYLLEIHNISILSNRSYGFATELFSPFGTAMGILASLSMFYSFYFNKSRYLFYTLIISVSVLLNSRTGILFIVMGIFFLMLFSINKFNKLINFMGTTLFISTMFCLALLFIGDINTSTYRWILNGINDLLCFFSGNQISEHGSSLAVLISSRFWTFPEGLELFLGAGRSSYALSSLYGLDLPSSDVGYVNVVWSIGILGSLYLLYFYSTIFYYAYKNSARKFEKVILLYLYMSFLLSNIKQDTYSFSKPMIFIFIVPLFIIAKKILYSTNIKTFYYR